MGCAQRPTVLVVLMEGCLTAEHSWNGAGYAISKPERRVSQSFPSVRYTVGVLPKVTLHGAAGKYPGLCHGCSENLQGTD